MIYKKFNLHDLPIQNLCVLLNDNLNKYLIEKSADNLASETRKKFGKYKNLSLYIKDNCKCTSKISLNSVQDNYIKSWKDGKSYIPLECVILLARLLNYKISIKNILKIKYKNSHNKNSINPFYVYDKDLAYLSEAIRVEGHIKKNSLNVFISNKNLNFIKKLTIIINKYLREDYIYNFLSIEVDIPKDKKAKEIFSKNRSFRFHIRQLDNHIRNKIIFYDKLYKDKQFYKILFEDGSTQDIKIFLDKDELKGYSSFGIAGASYGIQIPNMTFGLLLNSLLEIPTGRKTEIIKLPKILKESPNQIKISGVNAVLDSEGWVSKIDEKRIGIGMNSREYLYDIYQIFKENGISPSIQKNGYLYITSFNDLKRLNDKFSFISIKKRIRLKNILGSYKRYVFRRNEGISRITKLLRDNKELTAKQLSVILNKHKDTIFNHLNKGLRKNLIEVNKKNFPYRYTLK